MLMSALSGVAAALAVALAMTVYFRMATGPGATSLRHGLAALAAAALFAFAAYDMRHAALAYLGLNPSKPAVEFEIRMPRETLTTASDSQIELHTDRNQTLALVDGVSDLADGRALLRGAVALEPPHRRPRAGGEPARQGHLRIPPPPARRAASLRAVRPVAPRRPHRHAASRPRRAAGRLHDPLSRALNFVSSRIVRARHRSDAWPGNTSSMSEFRLTQISDTHLGRRFPGLIANFHRVCEHIDAA